MTEKTQTLEFSQILQAKPAEVYFALTNKVMMEGWLADAVDINAAPKGRFYAWWNQGYYTAGIFSSLTENESLTLTWYGRNEPGETGVVITLTEQDGGTLLKVTHSGLGSGEDWEAVIAEYKKAWPVALENLKMLVEKGVDKRLYDQPFMGVMIAGQLNEEQAKDLGVPVTQGIRLGQPLEGTGAQAAGLQTDDVLVKLNEYELNDFNALVMALRKFKAEQVVAAKFYRGAEEHQVDLKLSRRPSPEVPPTGADLAEAAKAIYVELDAELEALFAGVSEEEANQRPAEKEWSAKETVAHLLYTERWVQIWMSTSVGGQNVPGFFNDLGQVAALANAYLTVADLITELKRSEAVNVAAAAAFSDDFCTGRKFVYAGLAQWFSLNLANHSRGHFTQISDAIKAAREA